MAMYEITKKDDLTISELFIEGLNDRYKLAVKTVEDISHSRGKWGGEGLTPEEKAMFQCVDIMYRNCRTYLEAVAKLIDN